MPLPRVSNAVQRYFIDDLTRAGLDEVGPEGIAKLRDFVTNNEIDGFEVRPQQGGGISQTETDYLKGLLQNNELRGFLTPDGRRALESQLGLRSTIYGGLTGREVSLPEGTFTGINLQNVSLSNLAAAFTNEVATRADIFQNPRVSADEKGEKLFLLFKDYAAELNRRLSSRDQRSARVALLRALDSMPAARVLLLRDSAGDGFNNATKLVHNVPPTKPNEVFPARPRSWSTYQSMHGSFYDAAEKIDRVLKGMGQPAEVAAYEHRSAVAWLMGERAGNTITSSLEESRAISSTSGLDFVKGLFSPTDRVASLKLVDGFDIAVDFLDAAGGFVSFNRSAGDRMQAIEKSSGAVLRARIEEVPVAGEALSRYRPIFEKASGEAVPADKVTLVIMDHTGRIKGDGKAEASHGSGWWGFCDRNALNLLVTTRFGYPEPEQDVTLDAGGEPITFTAREILDITGRRMTELFSRYDYTGERFDDVLSQIELKDGTRLLGRIRGEIDTARPDVVRDGDMVTLTARQGEDPFGRVVVRVTQKPGSGSDALRLEATGRRGEKFEVKAEDIPGGFRPTSSRAIAWRVSPADVQKIADIVLPVVDALKLGRSTTAPEADGLRGYVTNLLDQLATTPDFDLRSALYRDWTYHQCISAWANDLEGAEARAEKFLPIFTELKQIYATQTDATARDSAIGALRTRDAYAAQVLERLSDFPYHLRSEVTNGDENALWRMESEQRTKAVLEWFDPADATKVARLKDAIQSTGIHKDPVLLLRTIARDEVLTGVESARAKLEATGKEEHQKYLPELRAAIGRIDELSLREDTEYDGSESGRPVTTYVFRVQPEEGSGQTWTRTYSVSETRLDFDRANLWSNDDSKPELRQLRDAVLAQAKSILASGTVSKTEEDMNFASPTTLPQSLGVAVSDGTTRMLRSSEIQQLVREEADDVPFHELIMHVKHHDGVTNADSWMNEGVSNGLHVFDSIRNYLPTDRDAPSWIAAMKDKPLFGRNGEVKHLDRVRFFDLGNEVDGVWSSGTRGWIEFDRDKRPVNSSVIQGMYDFLWSVEGKPNWSLPPTFNPHVPNDLVLRLYLRSVKDSAKLEALANDGLLPKNWRDYLA